MLARPSFSDAYLVTADREGPYIGAVQRRGKVWRAYLFGATADRQPAEAFATREDAGRRLIELAP